MGFDFPHLWNFIVQYIFYFYEVIITKLLNKHNCIDEGIRFYTNLLESNLKKHQKTFYCVFYQRIPLSEIYKIKTTRKKDLYAGFIIMIQISL